MLIALTGLDPCFSASIWIVPKASPSFLTRDAKVVRICIRPFDPQYTEQPTIAVELIVLAVVAVQMSTSL